GTAWPYRSLLHERRHECGGRSPRCLSSQELGRKSQSRECAAQENVRRLPVSHGGQEGGSERREGAETTRVRRREDFARRLRRRRGRGACLRRAFANAESVPAAR